MFSLQCTGVQEIYFSVDEEDTYCDWLSKLEAACASGTLLSITIIIYVRTLLIMYVHTLLIMYVRTLLIMHIYLSEPE